MKSKAWIWIVIAVVVVAGGVWWYLSANSEPTMALSKPLIVGLEAEPTSLDPFNSTDGVSMSVQRSMFEGLLTFAPDGKIIPMLAEKYTFNEDATAITFELKKGITFHDGSELTADVVKANFDFVLNKDNGLARNSFFNFISEIVVNNKHSITFKTQSPDSSMASKFAHVSGSIKSAKVLEAKKNDPNYNLDRNPVGTGPYMFGEWKSGEQVKVVAYKSYWDEQNVAKAEAIVFKPIPEASTRVNMLKTGEVHFVFPLPTLDADVLADEAGVEVLTGPSVDVYYIGMSLQHDKYKDVRVRQAMNYAIDKDQLIAQVVDGFGRIADSPIAATVYGYSAQEVYEYNVAKAKELMAEAGYEKGFKATLWTRNATEFISVAEFVAIQLREIGIEVEVQAYESGTMFDMLDNNMGTDIWIGRWGPGTGEADYGLRPNFASDRVPPSWNNSGFYINANVDQLLDEALRSSNQDVTLAKYAEIQEIVYKEAPWVFLYVRDLVAAKRDEVSNAYIDQTGIIRLNQASVK